MGTQLAILALAGAVGTLARYGVALGAQRLWGAAFPWGTLIVNALGCFLFGLVWTLAEDRGIISSQTRFVALTGFMGAFTTFSTYAFETSVMTRDGQWAMAVSNLLAQNVLGVVCVFLGFWLGRWAQID